MKKGIIHDKELRKNAQEQFKFLLWHILHKKVRSLKTCLTAFITISSDHGGWNLIASGAAWVLEALLFSNCSRFSCNVKKTFFKALRVGKSAARTSAFPTFHHQGQMSHSPTVTRDLGNILSLSRHSWWMELRVKGPGTQGGAGETSSPRTAALHPFPAHFLKDEETSSCLTPVLWMIRNKCIWSSQASTGNSKQKSLKIHKVHLTFIKSHFSILETDENLKSLLMLHIDVAEVVSAIYRGQILLMALHRIEAQTIFIPANYTYKNMTGF